MKLLIFFTASLLAGLACSGPTSKPIKDGILTITEEFFPDSLAVYTADHDIVEILTPLNKLNFEDDADSVTTFIVLADIQKNGVKVDEGLFMLKNGTTTKLLDNGRDAAAANDNTKTDYFAAKDGIYSYNAARNIVEKYGTVTDDLISIAKINGSDVIYVLTSNNVLLKVTEAGTKQKVVDKVVKAKEIVLDYQNNLYYYTNENIVYVLVGDAVKKIEGLPAYPSYVKIINPSFILENGVLVIVDNKAYIAYENGTSEFGDVEFVVRPTAYSMEATLIQYYGYNKKVYEYNILTILLGELRSDLKTFLEDKTDAIKSIASLRQGLGPVDAIKSYQKSYPHDFHRVSMLTNDITVDRNNILL